MPTTTTLQEFVQKIQDIALERDEDEPTIFTPDSIISSDSEEINNVLNDLDLDFEGLGSVYFDPFVDNEYNYHFNLKVNYNINSNDSINICLNSWCQTYNYSDMTIGQLYQWVCAKAQSLSTKLQSLQTK